MFFYEHTVHLKLFQRISAISWQRFFETAGLLFAGGFCVLFCEVDLPIALVMFFLYKVQYPVCAHTQLYIYSHTVYLWVYLDLLFFLQVIYYMWMFTNIQTDTKPSGWKQSHCLLEVHHNISLITYHSQCWNLTARFAPIPNVSLCVSALFIPPSIPPENQSAFVSLSKTF